MITVGQAFIKSLMLPDDPAIFSLVILTPKLQPWPKYFFSGVQPQLRGGKFRSIQLPYKSEGALHEKNDAIASKSVSASGLGRDRRNDAARRSGSGARTDPRSRKIG